MQKSKFVEQNTRLLRQSKVVISEMDLEELIGDVVLGDLEQQLYHGVTGHGQQQQLHQDDADLGAALEQGGRGLGRGGEEAVAEEIEAADVRADVVGILGGAGEAVALDEGVEGGSGLEAG